jgi:hypothetical protein
MESCDVAPAVGSKAASASISTTKGRHDQGDRQFAGAAEEAETT